MVRLNDKTVIIAKQYHGENGKTRKGIVTILTPERLFR